MDESTATLVGAFIGGIVGIAGTYLVSVYEAKKQQFFTACQRLREAFHNELAILSDPSDTSDSADILQSAFKKHLSAVIEFKYVLRGCRLDRFNKAWNEYYYGDGEISIPFLEQYSRHIGNIGLAKKNRDLAIKKIEHILSFTNT